LAVLPVFFTVILGFALGDQREANTLQVDLIDRDRTPLSARFLDELRKTNNTLVLCPMDNNARDVCALADQPLTLTRARLRVQQGDSAALIIIPAGYARAQANFTQAQIDFYSTNTATTPDPVRQTLDTVLQRTNSATLTSRVAGALLDR